jgi:hypothetical protein
MYIEFRLPSGGGGMAAQYCRYKINNAVREWAERFDIPYKTKTVKYTHRIILTCQEHYTLFGMSFEIKSVDFLEWTKNWRFVEPMSIDKDD